MLEFATALALAETLVCRWYLIRPWAYVHLLHISHATLIWYPTVTVTFVGRLAWSLHVTSKKLMEMLFKYTSPTFRLPSRTRILFVWVVRVRRKRRKFRTNVGLRHGNHAFDLGSSINVAAHDSSRINTAIRRAIIYWLVWTWSGVDFRSSRRCLKSLRSRRDCVYW